MAVAPAPHRLLGLQAEEVMVVVLVVDLLRGLPATLVVAAWCTM
jgi:hypothetical protein